MNSLTDTLGKEIPAKTDALAKTAQRAQGDVKKALNSSMGSSVDSTRQTLGTYAEDLTADVRKGASEAQKMIQEYTKSAMDLAKKHPVYATLAVVGAGLIIGSVLARRRD